MADSKPKKINKKCEDFEVQPVGRRLKNIPSRKEQLPDAPCQKKHHLGRWRWRTNCYDDDDDDNNDDDDGDKDDVYDNNCADKDDTIGDKILFFFIVNSSLHFLFLFVGNDPKIENDVTGDHN